MCGFEKSPALAIMAVACLNTGMMRLFWMSLIVWASSVVHAVELVGVPQTAITGQVVTFRWKTDVACGTRVSYGLSADKLDQKAEAGVTDTHEITLSGLKPGVTYHYMLGSARQKLHTGSLAVPVNSGAPTPERQSILDKVLDIFTPDQKPVSKAPATMAQPRAPPTRESWGRLETLQDHYDRHGADFQCRNPDEYAAQAWFFLQRGKAGQLLMKWDESEDTLRVFDPETRAFAAYNRDGMTKTYFRPNNASYWQRQPGHSIKPGSLPF